MAILKKNLKFILLIFLVNPYSLIFSYGIGITSIPKCGTFLLVNCIEMLLQKKGANVDGTPDRKLENITKNNFFYCHLAHSKDFEEKLKKNNYKIFFIYRDPRDQIVSHAYWIKKLYCGYKKQPIDQIITSLIKSINILYNPFLKWLKSDLVYPIRFENLIGQKGGGNDELQKQEIKKITDALGITREDLIKNCIANLFGTGPTYREGKIGSWKQHFSKEQKELFKQKFGKTLIELNYATDENW